MMVIILAEAEREFLKDADYYDDKELGLGIRFRNEVATVVDWIAQNFDVPRPACESAVYFWSATSITTDSIKPSNRLGPL